MDSKLTIQGVLLFSLILICSSRLPGSIDSSGGLETFDASSELPAGWINSGTANDTLASHYLSPPNCRALGFSTALETPPVNYPTSLVFYVDSSNNGDGKSASVDYRIHNGSYQPLAEFIVSTGGTVEQLELAGLPPATTTNVRFRFNSSFSTWYLDDVKITAAAGPGAVLSNIYHQPAFPADQDTVVVFAAIQASASPVAELWYRVGSGPEIAIPLAPERAPYYKAVIPAHGAGSSIYYRIKAFEPGHTNSSPVYSYYVRDSAAPVVELLNHAFTPLEGEGPAVYTAVRCFDALLTNVTVTCTTGSWQNSCSLPAIPAGGSVYYSDSLPGYPENTLVSYTVRAVNSNGQCSAGPTNTYIVLPAGTTGTNYRCRIMAANISDGQSQRYDATGVRILSGLNPDIVAIQEFNYTGLYGSGAEQLVADAFGTNFYYVVGTGSIPNGVISRWPITSWGEWPSPVANRDFTWATIDIPGGIDLHVVSVHLPTSNAGDRAVEATMLQTNIAAGMASTDYLVVAGDMNTSTRTEAAISTLTTFVSDDYHPADQAGDEDTNNSREKPYDYVLPNPLLHSKHLSTTIENRSFSAGLVYDSRVTVPFAFLPGTIIPGDSSLHQHMAVVKDFLLSSDSSQPPAPVIDPLNTYVVEQGTSLTFTVIAHYSGSAPLTLACSDPARFTVTEAAGTVTGIYTWLPGPDERGLSALRFTAQAEERCATRMTTITVVPEPTVPVVAVIITLLVCRISLLAPSRVPPTPPGGKLPV